MRLLQFITLTIRRFWPTSTTPPESALGLLRQANAERARKWLSEGSSSSELVELSSRFSQMLEGELPLEGESLLTNRQMILNQLSGSATTAPFYGTASSVSLLDTLPSFMSLSAAVLTIRSEWNVNLAWMNTAAEYMLQATLESYLIYGSADVGVLQEAFAWGFQERSDLQEDTEEWDVNAMFCGDDPEDRNDQNDAKWEDIKDRYLRAMVPEKQISLKEHLAEVSQSLPLNRFEEKVLAFVEALLDCGPKPVLVQLERGKLDDLSEDETAKIMSLAGLR